MVLTMRSFQNYLLVAGKKSSLGGTLAVAVVVVIAILLGISRRRNRQWQTPLCLFVSEIDGYSRHR